VSLPFCLDVLSFGGAPIAGVASYRFERGTIPGIVYFTFLKR